jgi:hypothetical protein
MKQVSGHLMTELLRLNRDRTGVGVEWRMLMFQGSRGSCCPQMRVQTVLHAQGLGSVVKRATSRKTVSRVAMGLVAVDGPAGARVLPVDACGSEI